MKANPRNYTVVCCSEAMSPITHGSGTVGNEAVVARAPVATPDGVRYVPFLSGNAIRHRAVREPGWRYLVDQYGLAGELDHPRLNFVFHGGKLTVKGGRENCARIADFQRIFPLGRLVGGSLPDQILSGSLDAWRGALVCEENRELLEHIAGPGVLPERLRPAESFLGRWQYTRGDAVNTAFDLMVRRNGEVAEEDSGLMIFAGQQVIPGAVWLHGFRLKNVSEIELGALLWSLRLWQAQGGTIGGQAARGHGILRTSLILEDGIDPEGAIDRYHLHVAAHRDEARAWLDAAFAAAPTRPKARSGNGKDKGRGAGAVEATTDPAEPADE